jgi:hypothetical protein
LVKFNIILYEYSKSSLNSYLNVLIQTLLFTPEFRGMFFLYSKIKHNRIFFRTTFSFNPQRSQSSSKCHRATSNIIQWKSKYFLSLHSSSTFSYDKVRKIIVELQRLFAEMLLLDQESCSSIRLTDSFGWQSNEVGVFFNRKKKKKHFLCFTLGDRSSRCSWTESFTIWCNSEVFTRHETVKSNSYMLRRIGD